MFTEVAGDNPISEKDIEAYANANKGTGLNNLVKKPVLKGQLPNHPAGNHQTQDVDEQSIQSIAQTQPSFRQQTPDQSGQVNPSSVLSGQRAPSPSVQDFDQLQQHYNYQLPSSNNLNLTAAFNANTMRGPVSIRATKNFGNVNWGNETAFERFSQLKRSRDELVIKVHEMKLDIRRLEAEMDSIKSSGSEY